MLMSPRPSLSFFFILCASMLFVGHAWCASISDEDRGESLLSLPYIQYVATEKAPDKVGTTIYKKDKVSSGYNIYTSVDDPAGFVHLIDMDGTLVHSWIKDPHSAPFLWKQVTPFPDGSLFLTTNLTSIDWQRVDVNSHVLATYDLPGQKAHHATYCFKDKSFLGLVANTIRIPFEELKLKARDNSLVYMSPEGQPLKIIPLSKLFADDPKYQKKLHVAYQQLKKYLENRHEKKGKPPFFDPFHANNIENLEWDIPGIAKKGDWLVTVRYLNRIFILDPQTEKIVWQWGDDVLDWPHHATFLKGDQILLLDNGRHRGSSRAIVLDIRSKKIVWQYGEKPGQEFFSDLQGSVQRLPNGNTLIAESAKGRVFEVTPSGEIVWEWYAEFYTQGELKGKRRIIYRMERIPYDFFKNVTFNHGKIQLQTKN